MLRAIKEEIVLKICIFGESGVGKTTLTKQYLTGLFETNIKQTIGAEIFVKYLESKKFRIVLQIWDFGGEEVFRFLLPAYSTGSDGGVFMFDLSNPKTLKNIDEWLDIFRGGLKGKKGVPILLVGGKSDLERNRNSISRDARELINSRDLCGYMICSAKTGEYVNQLFKSLVKKILGSDLEIFA